MSEYILEARGIKKAFHGVKALKGVDFTLSKGEIVSLIGANGAGKSTLCSIIAGIYTCDEGEIKLDGSPVKITSPMVADELGIGIVHQEPTLVPRLSVIENMFLNRERMKGIVLDFERMERECQETLDMLGYKELDIHKKVMDLSLVQREIVSIAKAMLSRPRILILDEVTAPLNHKEVEFLFETVRQLQKQDMGIIFISHKLKETLMLCGRVVVFRDGMNAANMEVTPRLMERDMIAPMLGVSVEGDIENAWYPRETEIEEKILLGVEGLSKARHYHDVNFQLHAGEIVGFAGLKGAGITELFFAIEGDIRYDTGKLFVEGKPVHFRSPRQAMDQGVGMVTNDRQGEGLALFLQVEDNIVVASYDKMRRGPFYEVDKAAAGAEEYIEKLDIKTPSRFTAVENLSGGNQQKVVVAKWLLHGMKVLIVDEPTRGVDVKAKSDIYRLLLFQRDEGKGVLMYSPETRELINVCDRIFIVVDGRIVEEITRGDEEKFNESYILRTIHETDFSAGDPGTA